MKHCVKMLNMSEARMLRPGVYDTVFKTKRRIQGCLNGCYVNYLN